MRVFGAIGSYTTETAFRSRTEAAGKEGKGLDPGNTPKHAGGSGSSFRMRSNGHRICQTFLFVFRARNVAVSRWKTDGRSPDCRAAADGAACVRHFFVRQQRVYCLIVFMLHAALGGKLLGGPAIMLIKTGAAGLEVATIGVGSKAALISERRCVSFSFLNVHPPARPWEGLLIPEYCLEHFQSKCLEDLRNALDSS